jgi:hypothetical protein
VTNTSSLWINASWRHRSICFPEWKRKCLRSPMQPPSAYPPLCVAPTRVDLIQLGTAVLDAAGLSLGYQIIPFWPKCLDVQLRRTRQGCVCGCSNGWKGGWHCAKNGCRGLAIGCFSSVAPDLQVALLTLTCFTIPHKKYVMYVLKQGSISSSINVRGLDTSPWIPVNLSIIQSPLFGHLNHLDCASLGPVRKAW